MKDKLQRLGQAKTAIDHGFSRVGPGLSQTDEAARALMLLSCHSVAVSNAIMVLARHNHVHEALPLLRALLELSARMRWIAQEDSAVRAREFFNEQDRPPEDRLWDGRRLEERCAALGFPKPPCAQILLWCAGQFWADAAGLPWAHVFFPRSGGVAPEAALDIAAQLMQEALAALERRWPGEFLPDKTGSLER